MFLVLHNIRSAHNVGSIFRTADAAGVSKIYLGGYTPTPTRFDLFEDPHLRSVGASDGQARSNLKEDKIAKVALGAEKTVPWEQHKQTWRLLEKFKKEGIKVIALEQSGGSIDYRKFKPEFPLALVLGNEVGGLSKEILKYADKIIAIPMYGRKERLNVSVAAGIALYKIIG